MKSLFLLLVLTIETALAGTHVNISFSQQEHAQNGPNLDETRKDQIQLQESDSLEQYQTGSNYNGNRNDRLARIQIDDKKTNNNYKNIKVAADSNMNREPALNYQSRSERVQNTGRSGHFNHQPRNQARGFYNSDSGDHQNYDQLRKISAQDKQNMEFERYIQHYHSGPTVETVYESAKPRSQESSETTSITEVPQRIVASHQRMSKVQKFERQVALPSTADNLQPEADAKKQAQSGVVNHQPVVAAETSASTSSLPSTSASVSSVPSVIASSSNDNSFKVNLSQGPSSVGKDGLNFDLSTSYSQPNYNDPAFQYENSGHSDGNFHNQLPPTVDEPQDGYGDYFQPAYSNNDNRYYGSFYDRQQPEAGYLPAEHTNQRPHITKTIQIAQPAIKAKKYEIRHPAIQKEFYDIEERVIIKPAGTVVVELERPVAKILKGETTLPLGHPHPAVAGAYMNNGHSPSFSNIIYSSSGAPSSNQATNYNTKNLPEHHTAKSGFTIASSVPSSPNFDQGSKDVLAESTVNKQYNKDNKFTAAATIADQSKSPHRDVVVLTDGNGNQRQVSPDQFSYSRDETDNVQSRPVYNHRNSFNSQNNGQDNIAPQRSGYQDSSFNNGQSNNALRRSGFQANLSNRDGYGFEAEYINNAGSANHKKDSKSARLEVASLKPLEHQQQPYFKHDHKIVLSPSQHNIYLSGKHDMPQTKFEAEPAHVREIKSFQNHRGPFILYASSKHTPYTQRSEYQPQARVSSQIVHYRDPARVGDPKTTDKHVEYSAPYAQMRYHPDVEEYANYRQQQKDFLSNDHNDRRKLDRLILEDKATTETTVNKSNKHIMDKQAPQAHIEIEIPHHSSQDANKTIVVNSTIRPTMMNNGKYEMHNSKLEISVTNNGEPMHQRNTNDNNESDNKDLDSNMEHNDNDPNEKDTEPMSNFQTTSDSNLPLEASENYESEPEHNNYGPQKFMRILEGSSSGPTSESEKKSVEAAVTNVQPHNVDINIKSTAGHVIKSGSRVIAATPAPKESSPSESFHKRRIVVNHPFQTVREVVEHEPYTNYHDVQVNEPASPALYHSDNYFQSNGALRQPEHGHLVPAAYYH